MYKRFTARLFIYILSAIPALTLAQSANTDSMRNLLKQELPDTARVKLLWQLARDMGVYNPDTAQYLAQQSLFLARKLHYTEGESRALGILANTMTKIGNYPRALELNILKLKIEEKRNTPRNLASVLMNIGVTYVLQEDYTHALEYYRKADSVINRYQLNDMDYYINLNIGDIFNRLNNADSAYLYFNSSLEIARNLNDGDLRGTSMTGLGHTYLKKNNYEASATHYSNAIRLLEEANDDETLCEALLGFANLFRQTGKTDSAALYAGASMHLAKKAGFLSKELEAATFLSGLYQSKRNVDSAFLYVNLVGMLNDSINSKSRIRESQIITSNEQFRQADLEEQKKLAKEERKQQLQLLLIAIFIPGLFLLTLVLSRVNLSVKAIRALGVLSLLFLFEYLTLLLHPNVAALTHHTPLLEILIFVTIAALLIPLHHRLEHWFIQKLIQLRADMDEKRKKKLEEKRRLAEEAAANENATDAAGTNPGS